MKIRVCKECGDHIVDNNIFKPTPYYCQGCGEDKEEYETELKEVEE